MSKKTILLLFLLFSSVIIAEDINHPNRIAVNTPDGQLEICPHIHAGLIFQFKNKITWIDPFSLDEKANLPKADYIFITHDHFDHLEIKSIKLICKEGTAIFAPKKCQAALKRSKRDMPAHSLNVISNDQSFADDFVKVKAVKAFNIINRSPNGRPFHRKGDGNGYIFEFGGIRIYVAGDTEKYDGMKDFGPIDVAILPILHPFCMNEQGCREALDILKPKVFIPYHYINPHTGSTGKIGPVVEYAESMGIQVAIGQIY